jgi:hypothetical protein
MCGTQGELHCERGTTSIVEIRLIARIAKRPCFIGFWRTSMLRQASGAMMLKRLSRVGWS